MNKTENVIKVGIADLHVITVPNIIRTSGLGSCIGVVIYDEGIQVAGLAHILLPNSKLARQSNANPYKYADTAIESLIHQLVANGARKDYLKAKIAGGAQMFQFSKGSNLMSIGSRNTEAVQTQLSDLHIPIISSDVGGNTGRTIEFDPATSKLKIRKVNCEAVYI
ncbi:MULTISPECIES: chemotaxis protein CheD [Virgibacillus]|uniref:Probable chemoreceptor glutamine deamidase CheD n=2 Tax=Virgibacillus TaxID=84406 RepID=A0A024QDS5_9BACI|nr:MULTISPECIES: chemotaxis protein CheD [Virgibacillus]EQB36393.1 hypothetical protein M948_15290 [Virgibacillus sp. CM-4]MYL42226.1 chemotaxis protein CheD [Virgibacillus massiliensis]GGJ44258.1 chemoreceptor glutamine deamidase CheD [Virgibacillus kapii]CDQ40091.1 Chemoreceptor glutamine deamidase CheD [Virgibacillus massiliensis]